MTKIDKITGDCSVKEDKGSHKSIQMGVTSKYVSLKNDTNTKGDSSLDITDRSNIDL